MVRCHETFLDCISDEKKRRHLENLGGDGRAIARLIGWVEWKSRFKQLQQFKRELVAFVLYLVEQPIGCGVCQL